ncbi:MAG: hypothetical protein QNK37_36665 [Acidobacteriota bacterium]|nr:hypothetical protein [Acidobacteriota bacterium]
MKKVITLALATGVVLSGFATLVSTPAQAGLTCFQQCRQIWSSCDNDPCACTTEFEYCLANC